MSPYQSPLPAPQSMADQCTTPGPTSASADIAAILQGLPTREELDGIVSCIQSALQRDIVLPTTTTSLSFQIQQAADHSELQQSISFLENQHASSMDTTLKLQLHMDDRESKSSQQHKAARHSGSYRWDRTYRQHQRYLEYVPGQSPDPELELDQVHRVRLPYSTSSHRYP